MNNILTASRMNAIMHCPRAHYWGYEVGLRKDESGIALRIGSAWARGMEARWNGASYDQALAIAIPEGVELDEYACATVAAMLAGYYDLYGPTEAEGKIEPEVEFEYKLELGFVARGKIDGLGFMHKNAAGDATLVEAKSTGDSLSPSSDYWLRLSFNLQVLNYIVSARVKGYNVTEVFYDVMRKPSIRPKQVTELDSDGKKIVMDADGKRVFNEKKIQTWHKSKGKKPVKSKVLITRGAPKQSASEALGETLKQHLETPGEYCDRLWRDTQARPDFYFHRREIPIIEGDLIQFKLQRLAIIKMILALRDAEKGLKHKEDAWPRNVSTNTCNFCQYKSFCLQNIRIDLEHLPYGFSIQDFNPELEKHDTDETSPTE